jgi:type II secretory pathway pseudopilin PulG
MSRRQINRRTRARVGEDRGFTIIETVIAMTVIFASLTALMYTATSGFRFIGLSRERQAATGAATRLMEQIHALSVDTITTGMETSDLAGDPKIKTPTDCGDGEYHFETCAGEVIVHTAGAPAVVPLNPHTGTLAAPEYVTDFSWATYVTNSDTSNDPYRLTVIVTWDEGAVGGAAKFIQVQSLWSSPKGCSATPLIHPFAGPCAPYFTGTATATQGSVVMSGTVNGASITTAAPSLFGAQAESRISAEQVSQVLASAEQSGVTSSTTTRGLATLSIAADGNPTTSTADYAPSTTPPAALSPSYGSGIAVTASPVAMSLSGGSSGDSGSATAADAATATTKCPSVSGPWPASQSDGFPCGWARAIRGATVSATVNTTKLLGTTTAFAGSVTLAQLSGTATLDTWADRVIPAGTTGTLTMTGQRTVGTMELIGIPAKFLAANVSNDTNTASTITTLAALQTCTSGNYAMRATAGTATAAATTGLSATNPSASWSGANVKVYDGSLGCITYGSANLNGSTAVQPALTGFTLQRYVRPGGSNHNCITYRVTPVSGASPQFGGVTTTKLPTSGTTLTDATATVNPMIQGQVRVELIYETNQNNSCTAAAAVKETVVDVTMTVSLGGVTSRAQYIAPPTGG